MKKHLFTCFLFLFVFTLVGQNPDVVTFGDTLGTIVKNGDGYSIRTIVTPNSPLKRTQAVFTVDAPVTICKRVISEVNHFPEFMPNVKSMVFDSVRNGKICYEMTLKVAWVTIRYVIAITDTLSENGNWCSSWSYVKGDIVSTTGEWIVSDNIRKPETSIIHYNVLVNAGRFVPAWISTMLTTQSVPQLITGVRKRAKEISR